MTTYYPVMAKSAKWATHLKKRLKTAEKGHKVCTPVPADVTDEDVKEVTGSSKVTRHAAIVCVIKGED
jgi:outer membrane receptor for Fe3+-dicitrate